ncbi:hypothetical protein HK102_008831, partial [Quaeritorhiza haematococci]
MASVCVLIVLREDMARATDGQRGSSKVSELCNTESLRPSLNRHANRRGFRLLHCSKEHHNNKNTNKNTNKNNDENNNENNNGNNAPPETPFPLSKSGPTTRLISHLQRQLHKKGLDAHEHTRAFTDYRQHMRSLRNNGDLLISWHTSYQQLNLTQVFNSLFQSEQKN